MSVAEHAATASYSFFLNLKVSEFRTASEVFYLKMNYDILFK